MPFEPLHFVRGELRTGFLLAKLALSARDEKTKKRNTENARKAYDAILHFLPKMRLTSEELSTLRPKLAELRSQLQALGEREERKAKTISHRRKPSSSAKRGRSNPF